MPSEQAPQAWLPSWTSIPVLWCPSPEEPDFFSVNWEQGLDWYRSFFRRIDATLVDASVNYTMGRLVAASDDPPDAIPRRIHEVSPEARFVYLVRDPAERCHSAYWHEVRAGREKRTLREAVEQSRYYVTSSYYIRSRDNPELRRVSDTDVVGDLIAVSAPVPGHVVAQELQHCDAEVLEGAVALVVGSMSVHQPP